MQHKRVESYIEIVKYENSSVVFCSYGQVFVLIHSILIAPASVP